MPTLSKKLSGLFISAATALTLCLAGEKAAAQVPAAFDGSQITGNFSEETIIEGSLSGSVKRQQATILSPMTAPPDLTTVTFDDGQPGTATQALTPVPPDQPIISGGFVFSMLGSQPGYLVNGALGAQPGSWNSTVYAEFPLSLVSGMELSLASGDNFNLIQADLGVGFTGSAPATLELDAYGENGYLGSQYFTLTNNFTTIAFDSTLFSNVSAVDFLSADGTAYNMGMDNVVTGLPVVPEPATLPALAGSLGLLLGLRRFRPSRTSPQPV